MRKPRNAILLPSGTGQTTPRPAVPAGPLDASGHDSALGLTLKAVTRAGIKRACLVIQSGDEAIRTIVGTGKKWGLEVVYARQAEPLGSADALLAVLRDQPGWINLKEPVLVTATDYFMKQDLLSGLVEGYARSGCDIAMSLEMRRYHPTAAHPGVMPGEDGRVRRLLEKPEPESPGAYEAALIYILPPDIWERLPEMKPADGTRFELARVVNRLLASDFTACGLMQAMPQPWPADISMPKAGSS